MTTRYIAFTVILEEPIRDDDAEPIIQAIRQLRGVADVVPQVADPNDYWARDRARHDILMKLIEMVRQPPAS